MIKPLKDKVLICRIKKEATTESGLILTGDVSEGAPWFVVLAIGPDVTLVNVDDTVIIDITKAKSVTVDNSGQDTYVIEEEYIMGIIEE
jgi:co-chaperonin GroES (HSP10)